MNINLPEFSKKVLTVLSGGALAQLIFLGGALFLPRWYGPEHFGAFAIFLSALNVLAILFPLRYELTLPLPGEEDQFRAVFSLALILSSGFLLLGLVLSPALSAFWADYSLLFFMLLSLASFLSAIGNTYQFALIRWEHFSILTRSRIWMALGVTLLQGLFFLISQPFGLIFGYTAGLILLLVYLLPKGPSLRDLTINRERLSSAGRFYFSIVRFSLPSGLLNSLAVNVQPLLLTAIFGPVEAGFFFLAYRIVGSPLSLLTGAIGQVYYPDVVKRLQQSPGSAFPFTRNLLFIIGTLIAAPLLLLSFTGPSLFSLILGEDYAVAGRYAVWLIPFFFGKAFLSPLSSLAEALDKTRAEFLFNLTLLCISIGCILLGRWQDEVAWFIIPYSLAGGILYLILLTYYLHQIRKTTSAETRI